MSHILNYVHTDSACCLYEEGALARRQRQVSGGAQRQSDVHPLVLQWQRPPAKPALPFAPPTLHAVVDAQGACLHLPKACSCTPATRCQTGQRSLLPGVHRPTTDRGLLPTHD